ncbi:MAG TPA: hypothetical protein VG247_20665 [Pseudonocardiaceae bacterium]|nr:hypothetical protein [Pseudonocardiaceae bacterium]
MGRLHKSFAGFIRHRESYREVNAQSRLGTNERFVESFECFVEYIDCLSIGAPGQRVLVNE